MKNPTRFRVATATVVTAVLLVSAQGAFHWLRQSDDQKPLGTLSAEFYQKGAKYVDQNYDSSTWKSYISKGMTPYHRLAAEDFKVDDQVQSDSFVMTMAFIHYDYRYQLITIDRNTMRAVLTDFKVRSGMIGSQSWRRGWANDPKVYLEHEQGHEDINELAAKTFAGMVAAAKLEGTGSTWEEARKDLDSKIAALYKKAADLDVKEQADYDAATHAGMSKELQAKATASIAAKLIQADIKPAWSRTGLQEMVF